MSDLKERATELTGCPDTAHEIIKLTLQEMIDMATSPYNHFFRHTERQFCHEAAKRLDIDMSKKLDQKTKIKPEYDLIQDIIEARKTAFNGSHVDSSMTVVEMRQVQAQKEAEACARVVLQRLREMKDTEVLAAFAHHKEGEPRTFTVMKNEIVDYFAEMHGLEL